jgi:predicted nucleotidyltransferase/uncharacterized protein (UPF0332 family)
MAAKKTTTKKTNKKATQKKTAKPKAQNKEVQAVEEQTGVKLTDDQKKQLDAIKTKLDTFKDKILEKFEKYILGVSLLPPTVDDKNKPKDDINVLVLIDDSDSKRMTKDELKNKLGTIIASMAKETDKKLCTNTVILSELWQSCYDGKKELLELIARSAPVFDKGMLAAVKIGEIHKQMVLQKFEKYIVSYVLFGSLTRGEATEKSDIDVAIIIDDTDVKKMTRAELKDKLRALIMGMGVEAGHMTGIKNKLNIQVYILTDFWESIKDANPVIFTILRDGIPFYDRGMFMPWKQLLKMGKIKPSQEAIDMFMNTGEEMIKRIRDKIKNLVESDIYWSTLTPSQAALMVYGIPPPTPQETINLMEEIFVKKEKILEKEYTDIMREIRKYYKELEHGELKQISGAEVDKLLNNGERYLKRIKQLFNQIYELKETENIQNIYDSTLTITRDVLKLEGVDEIKETEITKLFDKHITNKNIVPAKYLTLLKHIVETEKHNKDNKLGKNEAYQVKKNAAEYTKFMIEHLQRTKVKNIEKLKIKVKYMDKKKEKYGEILIIDNEAFIIKDIHEERLISRAKVDKSGQLTEVKESDFDELEKSLENPNIPNKSYIKHEIFANLKKIFGEDIEVEISN